MMLAPLFISLSVASVALLLKVSTQEEIVKVAAGGVAILCLFLSLYFAPLWIKAILLMIPLFGGRLNLTGITD
jgi:hypothetical protein